MFSFSFLEQTGQEMKIGSLEKKKTPKIRSSIKNDRILKQIAAKEKESAHDKAFDYFEKEKKKANNKSIEKQSKTKGSIDAKKKRKRKNISSKESLQECLTSENPHIEQDENNNNDLSDDDQGIDQNVPPTEESFDISEQIKRQIEIQNQMINELKQTAWKDHFPKRGPSFVKSDFIADEEKKKNIKKPSIPKVKGYYSWWHWNRTGLHPQHFRSEFSLYNDSKLESDTSTKILSSPWVFERIDSETVQFINQNDPIQIICCVCNSLIHGLSIPIWKGYHSHENCMESFGYTQ